MPAGSSRKAISTRCSTIPAIPIQGDCWAPFPANRKSPATSRGWPRSRAMFRVPACCRRVARRAALPDRPVALRGRTAIARSGRSRCSRRCVLSQQGENPIVSAPLSSCRDLVVQYQTPHGVLRAVDGVDLDIEEGQTVALVGESGCGKSTLGRAIVGLTPPHGGSIRLQGTELSGLASARFVLFAARFRWCSRTPMVRSIPG